MLSFLLVKSMRFTRTYILRSSLLLSPSIVIFLLCLIFKGSTSHALAIQESWQSLARLFPSMSALIAEAPPHGSMDAIGWTTMQGLKMSYTTLTSFSYFIWIPAAWLLTIYGCMMLFIGSNNKQGSTVKRIIVLSQFLAVLPLFALGSDFGR